MSAPTENATRPAPHPASGLLVAVAWLAVGLPAAWGVYRTAVNVAPLFHASSAPARPVMAPPPPRLPAER